MDAVLGFRIENVKRRFGRQVQKGGIFGGALQLEVELFQRRVPVVADVLVEFFVFLVR